MARLRHRKHDEAKAAEFKFGLRDEVCNQVFGTIEKHQDHLTPALAEYSLPKS